MKNIEKYKKEDIVKFYSDYKKLTELLKPYIDLLTEKINGYVTPAEKIKENYLQVKNSGGFSTLIEQEQEDYHKTVTFFLEYSKQIEKQYQDFFNGSLCELNENEYTAMLIKLNSDPNFSEFFHALTN